jgi:hypothetical protein
MQRVSQGETLSLHVPPDIRPGWITSFKISKRLQKAETKISSTKSASRR